MNKKIKQFLAVLLSIVLVLSLAGCNLDPDAIMADLKDKANQEIDNAIQNAADAVQNEVDKWFGSDTGNNSNEVTEISDPKISITMLDVGQGLSILVESGGEYLLYDGGDRATSSYVVSYLDKHDVDSLDYIIASHYDSDHIAGLVGVLETTNVENVINPSYKVTTKIYESYLNGVSASNANVIYPNVGDTYTLGYSTITILAPAEDYGDSNEMSVAVKITCDDFDCIITGDAEGESEADMLKCGIDLDAELYIVGHHGSSSSSSDAFVKAISPEYAFISCGENNDYGHPHQETLSTLAKYNVSLYRSDKDGEVTCASDGMKYAFSKTASQAVTDESSNTTENTNDYDGEYVLNTSSMKFHYANCSAVDEMSEKNKATSTKSREELIAEGYSPCGYCNP